jgi:hypothetical protein
MNKVELFNKIAKEQEETLLFLYREHNKINKENAYIYYEFTHRRIPEIIGFKYTKPFGILLKADDGNFTIQIFEDGEDIVFRLVEV